MEIVLEKWKEIPEYEGFYSVSNFGLVKSLERKDPAGRMRKGRYMSLIKHKQGYYIVGLTKKGIKTNVPVHLLMAKTFLNHNPTGTSNLVCDHIDEDKTNNTLSNLRLVTNRENVSKSLIGKGTSIYTGVSWCKEKRKWLAQIRIKGNTIFLGRYGTEEEASEAYQKRLTDGV